MRRGRPVDLVDVVLARGLQQRPVLGEPEPGSVRDELGRQRNPGVARGAQVVAVVELRVEPGVAITV